MISYSMKSSWLYECRARMQIYNYASTYVIRIQVCKIINIQISEYASTYMYASIQVPKHASVKVWKYTNMQEYRYGSLKVCKFTSMQMSYEVTRWTCQHMSKKI